MMKYRSKRGLTCSFPQARVSGHRGGQHTEARRDLTIYFTLSFTCSSVRKISVSIIELSTTKLRWKDFRCHRLERSLSRCMGRYRQCQDWGGEKLPCSPQHQRATSFFRFCWLVPPLHPTFLHQSRSAEGVKWRGGFGMRNVKPLLMILKLSLQHSPVLTPQDFNKAFKVQMHASNVGLGAVLCTMGNTTASFWLHCSIQKETMQYCT